MENSFYSQPAERKQSCMRLLGTSTFKSLGKKREFRVRNFLDGCDMGRRNSFWAGGIPNRIITKDEKWLHYHDPKVKRESSVWNTPGAHPPKKAKVFKYAGIQMIIMFKDRNGITLNYARFSNWSDC